MVPEGQRMKSISVAELHQRTDEWVRQVAQFGEIVIVDGGQAVARMQAVAPALEQGSFQDRRLLPEYVALASKPAAGTDVTVLISDDREQLGV
jgi:antitoxin (DNA-binding transcriptional repressor) of toxin-antitoxin stability system